MLFLLLEMQGLPIKFWDTNKLTESVTLLRQLSSGGSLVYKNDCTDYFAFFFLIKQ